MTGRTGSHLHQRLILRLHGFSCLPIAAFQILQQSVESNIVDGLAALTDIMHRHADTVRAMNQNLFRLLRIVLIRRIQIKMVFLAERIQQSIRITAFLASRAPAHSHNCALMNT